MTYKHTPANCPLCKGQEKQPLNIGFTTCNLCGNRSPEPAGGYRFFTIDTERGNKRIC